MQTQIGQQLDQNQEWTGKELQTESLKEVRMVMDPKLVKQKKTQK